MLIAWIFFRANDLSHALTYLQSMFGWGTVQHGTDLTAGLVYQPYYLLTTMLAAIFAWIRPQTWDWTGHLTWPKAAICLLLLWLSLAMLATQAYNPFIYFIF